MQPHKTLLAQIPDPYSGRPLHNDDSLAQLPIKILIKSASMHCPCRDSQCNFSLLPSMSLECFLTNCPSSSSELDDPLQKFIAHNCSSQSGGLRPIVCITSGGTTVPLEKRCVRFIDNFSAGTRGALSVEEFLEAGYAVVFLTRDQSVQPFCQDLGSATDVLSGVLEVDNKGGVCVRECQLGGVRTLLQKLEWVEREKLLLRVEFTTVFDYLEKLQRIAQHLSVCGNKAMFYLAAAVSDFYIPWEKLSDHKIQSREGSMQLDLEVVPKALMILSEEWAPQAFVVSFKLETDDSILLEKAKGAIQKYRVHAVVANILQHRKKTVKLVQPAGAGDFLVQQIDLIPQSRCLEVQIVKAIADLHNKFQS